MQGVYCHTSFEQMEDFYMEETYPPATGDVIEHRDLNTMKFRRFKVKDRKLQANAFSDHGAATGVWRILVEEV